MKDYGSGIPELEHQGDYLNTSRLAQTMCKTGNKSILKKQELYATLVVILAISCAYAITKALAIPRQNEDIKLSLMVFTVSCCLVYALAIDYKPQSRVHQCKAGAAVGSIKSVRQPLEIGPYVAQDGTLVTTVSDRNIPCCQKGEKLYIFIQ